MSNAFLIIITILAGQSVHTISVPMTSMEVCQRAKTQVVGRHEGRATPSAYSYAYCIEGR